jgi:hypothetical protein
MQYNPIMKHLRGLTKRYFSFAAMARYSSLWKLQRYDTNYQYHFKAFKAQEYNTSPPL